MPPLLKAAINGARSPAEHPAVPVSAEAIARDAKEAIAAGAGAIHFHIRNDEGMESLAPEDAERCITACRLAVPGIPLGVSTGAWIVPDVDERRAQLREWRVIPDFVSVNFHEDGAAEVARLLHERGVGIELGLSTPAAAERALAAGWGDRCLRILLEPEETDVAAALANVAAIERMLDRSGVAAPRLLHGLNETAWPLLVEAARRGYPTRIGLEDTLRLPTGETATGNAQLVSAATAMIAQAPRTT